MAGPYPAESTTGFAYEAITVAAVAIGFTASTRSPSNDPAAVRAVCTLETAQIRYRYDGTDPTAAEGHLLNPGDVLVLEGAESLSRFRAIRTGASSGTLRVTYER